MVSPEGVTTTQAVNIFGDITRISQTGPAKNGTGILTQTEYRAYDSQHQLCKAVRNDVGQTAMQRNVIGEIQWLAQGVSGGTISNCASTAGAATKVAITYDNVGGARSINYPDSSPDALYTRDPHGNLKEIVAGDVEQEYNYNSLHLLEDETFIVDGLTYVLDYDYNSLGHLSALTYPDSLAVNFSPNAFGRPQSVSKAGQSFVSNVNYYPVGSVDSFTFGNGITHKTTLNDRQVPSSLRDSRGSTTLVHLGYAYDDALNITRVTDHLNGAYSITQLDYDGLDRLTATTGNSGIGSSVLRYDGLGNITTYNSKGSTLDYHYNTSLNRLDSVSGSKAYDFTYDARGNVTDNGTRGFTYNLAGQMASSESNRYLYDAYNRRVKTVDSKGTKYSFYSKSGQLLYREVNGRPLNYIYLGEKLIAKDGVQVPPSNSRQHYKPYGDTIEAPKDDLGYTGHKFDTDLGLSYMQARYYDPVIGRFYGNDPVDSLGHFAKGNLHGFNRYNYANNNPYKYTDPDGRASTCGFIPQCGAGKMDAISQVAGAVRQATEPGSTAHESAKIVEKGVEVVSKVKRGKVKGAKVAKKVHGNSKASTKEQHLYMIQDADGNIKKIGVSGQKLNKNGTSPRAISQHKDGDNTIVLESGIPGRSNVLQKEGQVVEGLRKAGYELPDQKRPKI